MAKINQAVTLMEAAQESPSLARLTELRIKHRITKKKINKIERVAENYKTYLIKE